MVEAFAQDACGLQQVDEADRALESDGVEGDEGLFARHRLYVFELLVLVVDEVITFFICAGIVTAGIVSLLVAIRPDARGGRHHCDAIACAICGIAVEITAAQAPIFAVKSLRSICSGVRTE